MWFVISIWFIIYHNVDHVLISCYFHIHHCRFTLHLIITKYWTAYFAIWHGCSPLVIGQFPGGTVGHATCIETPWVPPLTWPTGIQQTCTPICQLLQCLLRVNKAPDVGTGGRKAFRLGCIYWLILLFHVLVCEGKVNDYKLLWVFTMIYIQCWQKVWQITRLFELCHDKDVSPCSSKVSLCSL